MSQPVLKAETNWSRSGNMASTREAIITALKETTNEGPGDFLKQLREIAKLELAEAAAQLGLSKDQVEAMEKNDYQQLPAPIYIKGFYRRYCNLLSVPAEPVIQAYEHSTNTHNPELGRVTVTQRDKHFSFKYVQYGIGIIILLIVIYSSAIQRAWPYQRSRKCPLRMHPARSNKNTNLFESLIRHLLFLYNGCFCNGGLIV